MSKSYFLRLVLRFLIKIGQITRGLVKRRASFGLWRLFSRWSLAIGHFKKFSAVNLRYFTLGAIFTFVFVLLPFILFVVLTNLPNPRSLRTRQIPQSSKILDRNGKLLYQIYSQQNRTLVSLADVPKSLIDATLAIEDHNFYNHNGVSFKSMFRALKANLSGQSLQGGSTITQQLIKSALLTPEISLSRKIKEIVLSLWAEKIYKKDEILTMYFNQVPYGGTAWGIQAAAETYFGKKVSDLNLPESALLAGLPAAPSIYSPHGAHPELSKNRQLQVLAKMREYGFITSDEEQKAASANLSFKNPVIEIKAPHFVMYVKSLLEKKYGVNMVEQGGLVVQTSLDLDLQQMASDGVFEEVSRLKNLHVGNGAALITNPKNGDILTMVGSLDYFDLKNDGNVNVTLSLRQPGSAIKVVNYALALSKGFTPASILEDTPKTYFSPNQPPYSPINYDDKFHGKVTLRTALASSYNVPAVKVLEKLGVTNMINLGRKMGISSWQDETRYGLSLTLGGGELTMLDMALVYGTLANGGSRVDLNPILKVKTSDGEVLEEKKIKEETVLDPGVSFLLSKILSDNLARTPAFGPNSYLNVPNHNVSVKTGTTNEKRDNWTIGYTQDFVVTVWVGNNDNSPMHPYLASGITGAAPIWNKIMTDLLQDKPDKPLKIPENVLLSTICPYTQTLPCEGCPGFSEYFLKGTEPKLACTKYEPPTPTP